MDDQQKTNQPLDQTAPPVAPSVPEDITPVETPIAPANITPPVPVAEPVAPPAPMTPPVETPPTTPWPVAEPVDIPPQAEQSLPPLETPTMEVPEAPTPSEPPMAEIKPKNKILPVIGGVLALLLVVGVAGAAYYVSNQLSTRQAVAPNAPTSKPAATDSCSYATETECNQHNCGVGCYWGGGSCHMSICGSTICSTGLDCGSVCCNRSTELCCSGGCVTKSSTVTACPTATPSIGCYHYPDEVAGDNATVCTPIDRSKSSDVTFATAGTIRIHQEGMIDPGTTITLTKGTETISATKVSDGNYDAIVTAGTYKVTVKLGLATEGGQASLGFILPNASNKCGRYLYDSAKIDITSLKTTASLTSYGISTTTGVDIPWQCWADRIQGEDTNTVGQLKANYDFDDFRLVIGYKAAQEVGACMDVRVYKVGTTTELTPEQLSNLKIGDNLRLELTSSMDNLKGRFMVKLGEGTPEYLAGTIDATNKKLVKSGNYTINANGEYSLQGQVSTTPTSSDWITSAECRATGSASTSAVGACVDMKIYRRTGTTYETTPLTLAQLQSLKVGDHLKFVATGSMSQQQGKFRVTVNGVAGNWMWTNVDWTDADKKLLTYSEYEVASAGTYKFEAQVTTTP